MGLRNDDLALSVNWGKGVYQCFRCGTTGRKESLPPNFKQPVILEKDKRVVEQLDFSNMVSLADSPAARNYLWGRGLDPILLENFVFVHGKQLVFPIYGKEGSIIYYVSRKMWGSGRRYDNMASEIKHLFIPYGCILPAREVLVVTEGVFDALSVWQWIEVASVGLLGMTLNSFKISKILEYSHPDTVIIILLDYGEYQTAVKYYSELIPMRKNTTICKLYEGDPNEVGKEELWTRLMPLVSYATGRTSLHTG